VPGKGETRPATAGFFISERPTMALYFPEGSSLQFSQTLASAKTITAITNANPAVATSVAHGYTTGDEILLTSGWEDATDTVWKITVLTADTFSIQGLDATNTSFYPVGTGTGTAQKLSSWTVIPHVLSVSGSGGDARFTDVNLLSRRNGIRVPTGFNATSVTLTMAHDAAQAAYQTMLGIARNLSKVAFKQVISGGAVTYGYGYMSVSEMPTLNNNQVNTVNAAITVLGRSISY
jgi:hypothetical protein